MGVVAIRIYLGGHTGTGPMADLLMVDGTIDTIEWEDIRLLNKYKYRIDGHTLIYDERPRSSWDNYRRLVCGEGICKNLCQW